jgi:hypothetical protein
MDKAAYDKAKQSPMIKQMGMRIEPLEGVSPEALYLQTKGTLDVTFVNGANSVRLQITKRQGLESDTATAQALGKLIIQRLP